MKIIEVGIGENIHIGDNIRLAVTKLTRLSREGQPCVHIGIEAPRSVSIDRAEVHEQIVARGRRETGSEKWQRVNKNGDCALR